MIRSIRSRKPVVWIAVASLIVVCAAIARAAEQPGGVTTFSAAKIKETRTRAAEATRATREGPDGWSKSRVDPMRLLPAFTPLKLKEGVVLRAYQYKAGGNGNGVIWALPAGAAFPEPGECPKVKREPLVMLAPKPPAALPSIMGQIQGDGSPWSYMAASFLGREIQEFGAMWHGSRWGTHRVLDSNPFKEKRPAGETSMHSPSGDPSKWKWTEPEPKDWRPSVRIEKNRVTVRFYTYSGYHKQKIVSHTDVYTPGSYRYTLQEKEIATGPGGFMF